MGILTEAARVRRDRTLLFADSPETEDMRSRESVAFWRKNRRCQRGWSHPPAALRIAHSPMKKPPNRWLLDAEYDRRQGPLSGGLLGALRHRPR